MSIPQSGDGTIEHFEKLAEMLEQGSKSKSDWRIGTEHEKFGWITATRQPLPYDGPASINTLFRELTSRYGWTPVHEDENTIGLTRNGANISLEPGGQFELSGAPMETVHETAAELQNHLSEVASIATPLGIKFMGIGTAPEWRHEDMPVMPKGRYRLMTDYMGRVGTHGTQMMYRTSTVQVNLDYSSEADMVKKLRVSLALQPVATALFASSPFFDGKPNGHKSWRSRIWRGLDNSRTGMLPFAFDQGFGFQQYVDWILDVPMYFVYRNGKYINALGQSFRAFLRGELPAMPGEKPTLSDWANHITTVFPEVRIKKYIEMRGADCGDQAHIVALPAFWVGIIYDQTTLDAAWDLVKDFDAETREALRVAASVQGLEAEVNGIKMINLARAAVDLSQAGLTARGKGEEIYLAPLIEAIKTGKTQADRWLDLYNGPWNQSLARLYEASSL